MKTVTQYIDELNNNSVHIVLKLQSIIKEVFPEIKEKISYGVPFYYYNGPLCYINAKKQSVDFGFTKGHALNNKQLEMKGRKQVATLSFYSVNDISKATIKEILLEAASLNDFYKITKKR